MANKNYQIITETDSYILIEDISYLNGGRTITNDAERVVNELIQFHDAKNKMILYRDTEGYTDQLLHDGKKFLSFRIVGPRKFGVAT